MDPTEVKDRLKSVVNSLIKDQPEEASKELHDVLAAKMRGRVSGETETEVVDGTEGAEGTEAVDPPDADVETETPDATE